MLCWQPLLLSVLRLLQMKNLSCGAAKTSLLRCSAATLLCSSSHTLIDPSHRGSVRHQYVSNSKCISSAVLTTFKAFSRYNHTSPVGLHCVWSYSVKPQLAISTHFPVMKPVVISQYDCTHKLRKLGLRCCPETP